MHQGWTSWVSRKVAIYPWMFHGFWWMGGMLQEARHAISHTAERLSEVMAAKANSAGQFSK
jgi:hypothetical protein